MNHPWNFVFLAGFIVYCTIRGIFEKRTRDNEKVVNRSEKSDRVILLIVIAGNLLLPVLYIFSPWLSYADYKLPPVAPWIGVGVMLAALWLFWRSHSDLGQNWSVTLEIRKGHELVTHGVYSKIRHPMYASIWLFSTAQGLMLENWLAGWSAFATFAVLYFVRTPREERMMCEFFGEEYREYMKRTGRIFPRIF